MCDRRLYYTDPRKHKPNRGHVEGAGLSSMRRMSFDEDDVYSDDEDEERRRSHDEEEKHEDEPEPHKKYRNRFEELADKASFVEVAYLIIYGHLPSQTELDAFTDDLNHHALLHEDMKHFFANFSGQAHPMAILSAMVASLSGYYGEAANGIFAGVVPHQL